MNSYLIDSFVDCETQINGKWHISKPLSFFFSIPHLIRQTIDLWIGRGYLIHFKEDEMEKK